MKHKKLGKIQGERLDIEITSLEYDGTIIPVTKKHTGTVNCCNE